MTYSKILAALNMSDEELERQQRLAQRQERDGVKQQERADRAAGWPRTKLGPPFLPLRRHHVTPTL